MNLTFTASSFNALLIQSLLILLWKYGNKCDVIDWHSEYAVLYTRRCRANIKTIVIITQRKNSTNL